MEIEKELDEKLTEVELLQVDHKDKLNKLEKEIVNDRRHEQRAKNMEQEQKLLEEKRRKKQLEK